jgi:hypothetical protein
MWFGLRSSYLKSASRVTDVLAQKLTLKVTYVLAHQGNLCAGTCQLGIKGVVVGQGDTYEGALSDVKSAIRFHIETFGEDVLDIDPPILEAFVAEAGV